MQSKTLSLSLICIYRLEFTFSFISLFLRIQEVQFFIRGECKRQVTPPPKKKPHTHTKCNGFVKGLQNGWVLVNVMPYQ